MLPLSDGIHARRFPFVNVALIIANFAVWIFYEIPHLNSAVFHASFYPCTVNGTCHGPEPWGVSWFTAMFMHGSWDHILGNMLFLAIFGKNVEDALGHGRYLAFYIVGGFVAAMTQALMTLIGGTAAETMEPMLGASGAIAAVLGAYFVLYPDSRILTLVLVFPVRSPLGCFSAYGFCTSSSRPTSASSPPAPTVVAWRSSPTSAASCSGCLWPGSWPATGYYSVPKASRLRQERDHDRPQRRSRLVWSSRNLSLAVRRGSYRRHSTSVSGGASSARSFTLHRQIQHGGQCDEARHEASGRWVAHSEVAATEAGYSPASPPLAQAYVPVAASPDQIAPAIWRAPVRR